MSVCEKIRDVLLLMKIHKNLHLVIGSAAAYCVFRPYGLLTFSHLLVSLFILSASTHVFNDLVDVYTDIKKTHNETRPLLFSMSISEGIRIFLFITAMGWFSLIFVGDPLLIALTVASYLSSIFYCISRYVSHVDYIFELLTYFFMMYAFTFNIIFPIIIATQCLAYNIAIQYEDLENDALAGMVTLPVYFDRIGLNYIPEIIIHMLNIISISLCIYMFFNTGKLFYLALTLPGIIVSMTDFEDKENVYRNCRFYSRIVSLIPIIMMFLNI